MLSKFFIGSIIFLSFNVILCIIRAIKGPTVTDRLIAINVIGTKTIVLISIVSFILKETYFIDVVLVYALISFIASIVISGIMERTGGSLK